MFTISRAASLLGLLCVVLSAFASEEALTTQEGLRSALTKDMYSFFAETMPHPFITNDHKNDAIDIDDDQIARRGDDLARSVGFVNLEEGVYGLQATLRHLGLLPPEAGVNSLHAHPATMTLGSVCHNDVQKFCADEAGELQFIHVASCLERNERQLGRNCQREFSTSLAKKCAPDMARYCDTLHLRTLGDVFVQEVLLSECFDKNAQSLQPQCRAAIARAVRPPVVVPTLGLEDKAPVNLENSYSSDSPHGQYVPEPAPVPELPYRPHNPSHPLFDPESLATRAEHLAQEPLDASAVEAAAAKRRRSLITIIFLFALAAGGCYCFVKMFPTSPVARFVRSVFGGRQARSNAGGGYAKRVAIPTSDEQYQDDFTDAHYDL